LKLYVILANYYFLKAEAFVY